ncbi:MAG: tRNA preQ1(34) S-adenosylmethionine ribosyltransferase-isomerase QueA [Thermoleophilia bacterium]|nr:tRNA preQ1(34) S-adenosylmethionine ribosyltransferase-isomerase QueA [Thermoleophilia bacterium]
MHTSELDFDLPQELIAQHPAEPRDSCRLMYLPASGPPRHLVFSDLPELLEPGDTLVFNDSKVLPARVLARKATGGQVELLFLNPRSAARQTASPAGEQWEALARPSHRLRVGTILMLPGDETLELVARLGEGKWLVQGPPGQAMVSLMEAYGQLPLPPYIREYCGDPNLYQTVYAAKPGSAAAPTAGLHFTERLLARLEALGVRFAFVTLHVGLDTFLPIREELVEEHRIHKEHYYVSAEALRALRDARRCGSRIVAVGTTAVRVLETVAESGILQRPDNGEPVQGFTDLYITPGYVFKLVDTLITNFHLPRSTLLALVMAFGGKDRIRQAYAEAIACRYRFFSFGDAMMIERATAEGAQEQVGLAEGELGSSK